MALFLRIELALVPVRWTPAPGRGNIYKMIRSGRHRARNWGIRFGIGSSGDGFGKMLHEELVLVRVWCA